MSFYADQKKVAEHDRAFGHSDWRIDPLHYLELIRRKVASFESARPIRQWRPQWPAHYETALERLRDRHGYSRGTREFIGILQLHQDWDLDRVSSAIQGALDAHCIELDAVRHILMRQDTPTRSHAPLESGLMPGITDLTIAGADLDLSGHFKSGQRWSPQNRPMGWPGTVVVLPLLEGAGQARFSPPAPRSALEDVTVV